MSKDSPEPSQIPGILVVVFLAFGAIAVHQIPLESSRPHNTEKVKNQVVGLEDVDARLWQDPFAAVNRHIKEKKAHSSVSEATELEGTVGPVRQNEFKVTLNAADNSTHSPQHLKELSDPPHLKELRNEMAEAEGKLSVIAVMVFGGPYPADEERRRRMRYAIVSGLAASDYFPDDSDHIGYIKFFAEGTEHLPEYVPYDWFNKKGETSTESKERLLLLWLDDDVFRPENKYASIIKNLTGFIKRIDPERCNADNPNAMFPFPFSIFGPAGSSNLIRIIDELKDASKGETVNADAIKCLRSVTLYSPAATALEKRGVQTEVKNNDGYAQRHDIAHIQSIFKEQKIGFLRTIGTDSMLTDQLVEELALRGVNATCKPQGKLPQDHIAVISELDTDYARLLRKTLIRSVKDKDASSEKISTSANDCDAISIYSYQRGLDGDYLGMAATAATGQSKKDNQNKDTGYVERAEGGSQIDYLRRLTTRLSDQNQELRRTGRGEIKAIGVLGSDLYDKLLVLQALRRQFPNVIFFTTDLDARLLHPSETEWTRNLIVASHFGLELHPEYQRDIPPFRDNYQTAMFLATLLEIDLIKQYRGKLKEDFRHFLVQHLDQQQDMLRDLLAQDPDQQQETLFRDFLDQGPDQQEETFQDFFDRQLNQQEEKESFLHFLDQQQQLLDKLIQPRIFEIGRTMAFEFSPRKSSEEADCKLLSFGCQLYPEEAGFSPDSSLFIYGFHLFLVLASIWLLFSTFRRFVASRQAFVFLSVFVIASLYAAYIVARVLLEGADREPFAWLEGVSLWPTELLRLIATGLSIYFVRRAYVRLLANNHILTDIFFGGRHKLLEVTPGLSDFWPLKKAWAILKRIYRYDIDMGSSRPSEKTLNADELWKQHLYHDSLAAQSWRVIPVSAVVFLAHYFIVVDFGIPHIPYRSALSAELNLSITLIAAFFYIVLIFYVADTIRLCKLLIEKLCETTVSWSAATRARFGLNTPLIGPDMKHYFDEWISLQLIAQRTQAIGPLIYYPFIICILLLIAQSPVFDNWDMPVGITLVYMISILIAASCAIMLRLAAENFRKKALGHLNINLLRLKGLGSDMHPVAEQLELVVHKIETIREGAFAPFAQQPLVKAIITMTGGFSGFTLVEHWVLTNI